MYAWISFLEKSSSPVHNRQGNRFQKSLESIHLYLGSPFLSRPVILHKQILLLLKKFKQEFLKLDF